ncbi:MAG: hypothetical protein R3C97_12990 [Geminicoccaceae bacterium]
METDSSQISPEKFLATLPRLSAEDLIPEVNGLMIDAAGNLVPRARKQNYIVTYSYLNRRVTARFSGGRDEPITMELGCRLIRIPYSAEGASRRKALIERVWKARGFKLGNLSITHHQWLYLRDRLRLEPAPITASWLVGKLVTAAIILRPTIETFVEFENAA